MGNAIAFIQNLVSRPNGLAAIYTALTTRLTATRAGYLDNLADLTGPAALQQNVGTHSDPPALNSTLFAAVLKLDADVLTLYNTLVAAGGIAPPQYRITPVDKLESLGCRLIDPATRSNATPTFLPLLYGNPYLTWAGGPALAELYQSPWVLTPLMLSSGVSFYTDVHSGAAYGTNALRFTTAFGTASDSAPPYILVSGNTVTADPADGHGPRTVLTIPPLTSTYNGLVFLALVWHMVGGAPQARLFTGVQVGAGQVFATMSDSGVDFAPPIKFAVHLSQTSLIKELDFGNTLQEAASNASAGCAGANAAAGAENLYP